MFHKSFFTLCLLFLVSLTLNAAPRRFTVVIDAGHGGNDCGAKGLISYEKNLTLRYALALGSAIEKNFDDVRVVYTRRTDVFIPLHERADIANRNKADLFMSFHINAVEGSRSARGFQTWTLGRGASTGNKGIMENLDVAKRENSVILMEKDYKQVYKGIDQNSAESDIMFEFIADKNRERSVELAKLMQREVCRATGRINAGAHQNNLAVLRLSSMPSCLLELGFISTPDEERFLNSDAALTLYTQGIFNAFLQYKMRFADKITVPYKSDDNTPRALPQIVPDEYRKQQPAAPAPAATPQPQTAVTRQAATVDAQRQAATPDTAQATPAPKAKAKTPAPAPTAPAPVAKTPAPAVKTPSAPAATPAGRPVFKVQILSSSAFIKAGDKHFKGLAPVDCYQEGEWYKYTYGASTDYNEIARLRKSILDRFPEAFIVAFKGGQKMNVGQAIREFKSNK